jgi:hypothetical protein
MHVSDHVPGICCRCDTPGHMTKCALRVCSVLYVTDCG